MNSNPTAEMVAELRRQVDRGDLEPGQKLPSTRQLMATYGMSESGVFRAVSLLKAEGVVKSQQGKGVFVADRRELIAGARRIAGITRPGEEIHWRYSTRVEAPEWVAEFIGAGECVERARTVRRNDVIHQASRSWVHLSVVEHVPELDEPAPCDPTWQAVYTRRSGQPVSAVSKQINARIVTDEDRQALELDDGLYAAVIVRSVYVSNETTIGVGENVFMPDHPIDLNEIA